MAVSAVEAFIVGLEDFAPADLAAVFIEVLAGFHPGFGGSVRHRFAGSPRHRVWGRGWAWWGYGADRICAYANPYYPYDSSYTPKYEDSSPDNDDVSSYYDMPYPYFDGGYWRRGRSLNRYGRSNGDLGEGWRTCPISPQGSCVIKIP